MKKELVIAHYAEDESWITDSSLSDWSVKIYYKSIEGVIGLPNIGREASTYLYHIIENYNNLADETVFCQGDPFGHSPNFLNEVNSDNIFIGPITYCNSFGLPHADWVKMPAYCNIFEMPLLEEFVFAAGAQYRVTKLQIQSRNIDFYKGLFALCMCDPTAAWTLERLWPSIWNLKYNEIL